MRFCLKNLCLLLTTLAAGVLGCSRDAVPVLTGEPFPPATDSLSTRFASAVALVELSDGRVVIADRRTREVLAADFDTDSVRPHGRAGDGPGEFRSLSSLLRLHADTVAVVSRGLPSRVSLISPRGQSERSVSIGVDAPESRGSSVIVQPGLVASMPTFAFADTSGRLYGMPYIFSPMGSGMGFMKGDSAPVLRVSLTSARVDTAAWLRVGDAQSAFPTTAGGNEWTLGLGPFAAVNEWGVFDDGTIALIMADDYTITTISPEGVRRMHGPFEHATRAVSRGEWRQHMARERAAREAYTRRLGTLAASSARSASGGTAPSLSILEPTPPSRLPPLAIGPDSRAVFSDREVWLPLSGASPEASTRFYDVIDKEGRFTQRYMADGSLRLVAASRRYLYTVSEDDDGLFLLRRHARGE
jgi:hypothetical protein